MCFKKIPLDEKCCPGCGVLNPKVASYCNSCQVAVNSYKLNGWAHYHKIESQERKEAIAFIDNIRLRGGFLTAVDPFYLVHYYQITHKLSLKYNKYAVEKQIWLFFVDLLIWSSKQKGNNLPFNKMSRQDIYKILMTKNANK